MITLRDLGNFKAFKVVVAAKRSAFAQVAAHFGAAGYLLDPDTAFISEQWLRSRDETRNDAAWQSDLGKMIVYAVRKGWFDSSTGAIQAHVEWTD